MTREHPSQITRREFLAETAKRSVGTLAIVGGATAGATLSRSIRPRVARAQEKRLVVWWWGDQEAQGAKDWMAETVQLFEQAHPGVTVETVLQTTDGLYPAFEAAAAAREGPDVQYLWGGINTLAMAWKGYLAPISDFLPQEEWQHYLNHQEDSFDGKLWSAPWYTQPSFPLLYNKELFQTANLDPEAPPQTWDEFLTAGDALKTAGIIPLAGGIKDGWLGGWLFSVLSIQTLDTIKELMAAVTDGDLREPKFSEWIHRVDETIQRQFWNDDVTSLELYQGQALWSQGKAAMSYVAGSDIRKFVTEMGADKCGVLKTPRYGNGQLAGTFGSTSQTLAIPSFAKEKELAAEFIKFVHEPDRMRRFYEITGSIPADDRFPIESITLPQQQQLFEWMTKSGGPYPENFIPLKLDADGNFAGMQLLFSKSKSAEDVINLMQQVVEQWREESPEEVDNFRAWQQAL
ncbi:MAG: hypothetical protein C4345_08390 [Chloroflexota bacterium]